MRLVLACCSVSIALALCGCSSGPSAPELPFTVGNGVGEQYGNYGAQVAGEMRVPSGERCVLFNWDRPISRDFAIRYVSASCESQERPGHMVCREVSRTVIPISESNLKDGIP